MSNRFKCLLDEEQPERGTLRRRNREQEREREKRYVPLNIFKAKEKEKEKEQQKIENNEINFPSLECENVNKINKPNQIEVSYGSILKNEEKIEKKKSKKTKLKKGWVQLGVKREPEPELEILKKEEGLNEYLYFIDCMVNLYEHQKLEKIEILGEENYEHIYKFPNYDYEYFDKLNEKYEDELEAEIKNYNNDLYGYNSDNST
jgi:hypothetical protein